MLDPLIEHRQYVGENRNSLHTPFVYSSCMF